MSRRLVAGLLALCAAGAADDDTVRALSVPADGPELRALAEHWRQRWSDLRPALADPDPQRRRGAARLAAAAGAPPSELLAALLASGDAEAQRLGLCGLRSVDALPPADLLKLAEPALACLLLTRQTADPFATAVVAERIRAWLLVPATCEAAAGLCCARGTPANCGPALVAALAVKDESVVDAAHTALCVLTRIQRSRSVYAGHNELLAKDWRDALAAAPAARGEPSPELAALVADLPAPAALVELLAHGPAGLAAVERAMEGADKSRRRELAVAARLLARDVSPALWRTLGAAGLDAMDAAQPRERLTALARATDAVRSAKDGPGLLHLFSYADDRDPAVRAALYDRLVRLSDSKDQFAGSEWRLGDGQLFPPGRVLHRLRRSLSAGASDEQVSALQFIAGLSAGELGDDVATLLLSPSPVVVDTALETLSHLGSGSQQAALLRLAQDQAQPPARRVRVIELLVKSAEQGSSRSAATAEPLATLERIANGQPPLVALAARKAWVKLGKNLSRRRAALVAMLADPAQRIGALTLIRDEYATDDEGSPPLAALVVPHLRDADAAVAALAADCLLRTLGERKLTAKVRSWFDPAALAQLAADPDHADGRRLALAWSLKQLDRDRVLARAAALPVAELPLLGHALLAGDDHLLALGDLATLMHGRPLDNGLAWSALRLAKTELLLQRPLLEEIGHAGALGVLPSESAQTEGGSAQRTRTIRLEDGRSLSFTTTASRRANIFGDDSAEWTLARAPEPLTTAERATAFAAAVDALPLAADSSAMRELILAITLRRALPESAEAAVANDADAWRLLAARDPVLRARLAARANAHPPQGWNLLRLIRDGEPDLLPAVVHALASERQTYLADPLVAYLVSLPAETVAPHLPELLANPLVARSAELATLLGSTPLPLACVPALARSHPAVKAAFATYTPAEAMALVEALTELDEPTVLGAANLMRAARSAAPASFDPVLRRLVERGDARAAAWMRSGLPLEAGMDDLYVRALDASEPEVWLVGAAKALKEGRLDAGGFITRVVALPPPAQAKAALVAARYLDGKLAGEAAGLARVIATCPAKALSAWIALLPPDPAIAAALAGRVGDPTVAGLVGFALDARLRADRERWRPLVDTVVAGAGGQLDYLKPR